MNTGPPNQTDLPSTLRLVRNFTDMRGDDNAKVKFAVEHLRTVVQHYQFSPEPIIDYYGPFYFDNGEIEGWWSILTLEGHQGPRPSVWPKRAAE